MLRKLVAVAVAALSFAACDVDLSGLTAADQYAGDLVNTHRVALVDCPAGITVGGVDECFAVNEQGAIIERENVSLVQWGTTNPAVIAVDINGQIQGVAAGTASVFAVGAGGTSDTVQVQVF
jgi:hypothetical protein